MQKNEHILDQFLKEKVEESNFDFDESNWLKVSQMLDDEDKKKRDFGFWRAAMLGTLVLLLGIGSVFISKIYHGKKQKNNSTEISKQHTKNNVSYQVEKDIALQKNIQQEEPISNQENTNNITKDNPTAKSETQISEKETNKDLNEEKGERTQKSIERNLNAKKINAEKTFAKQINDAQEKDKSIVEKNSKIDNVKNNTKEKESLEHKNSIEQNNNPNTIYIQGKAMMPIDTQVFAKRQSIDPSISNPRYHASLKDYVAEKLDTLVIYTFTPKKEENKSEEQIVLNVEKNQMEQTIDSNKKSIHVFILAGININKGMNGNSTTHTAAGVSPLIAIGLQKKINEKISLAAHIGFTYFNAMNIEKRVTNYKYSFGFDSTQISVIYKRMYQLSLPISVAYKLDKKQSVWAGIGATYLLNTLSKYIDDNKHSLKNGYMDGIKPFDLFVNFAYQYQINKKFGLQAGIQQGMINALDKNYFSIKNNNTQTRLSIGLKYYFNRNGQ